MFPSARVHRHPSDLSGEETRCLVSPRRIFGETLWIIDVLHVSCVSYAVEDDDDDDDAICEVRNVVNGFVFSPLEMKLI